MNPTHPPSEVLGQRGQLDELQSLAAQSGWIDGLARRLVADAHLAEDLVQDAWVEALLHGGGARGPLSAWMAGAVKRLAQNRQRAAARSRRREEASARPEETISVSTGSERLEQQQLLIQNVLELDEPYREVIVQRYVDELPPREIARRLGVPVATVNSRLARGLAQLRECLLRAHGGDETRWLGAMVSLSHVGSKDGMALLGVALMKSKLTLVSALIFVLLGGWLTASIALDVPERPPAAISEQLEPLADAEQPQDDELALHPSSPESRRAAASAPEAPATALRDPWTVRIVHGESGQPAAGAELFVLDPTSPEEIDAVRGADPRYQLQMEMERELEFVRLIGTRFVADERGEVRLEGPDGRLTLGARLGDSTGFSDQLEGAQSNSELRLWRHGRVEVLAVDAAGRPIPDLQVAVRQKGSGVGLVLDRERTDGDGRALLRPWLAREAEFEVDELEVFVDAPLAEPSAVALRLDPDPEASVTLKVADLGSLEVELWLTPTEPLPDGTPVAVEAPGEHRLLPRVLRSGVLVDVVRDGRVRFPRLGLGLELDLAVPLGAHQEAWQGEVEGPTQLGEEARRRIVIGATPHVYTARVQLPGGLPLADGELLVTYTDASRSGHQWRETTDAEGGLRFELVGYERAPEGELRFVPMREGGSRVEVARELAQQVGPGPHDLGLIEFAPEPTPILSGHVLDPNGRPVPDVWVIWTPGPESLDTQQSERTDADGRFTFYGELGNEEVWLRVYSQERWRHEPQQVFGASTNLRLQLLSTATIEGQLRVDEDVDLSDVVVGVWPASQGPPAARQAYGWDDVIVSADGSFLVRGLEPGSYSLVVDFVEHGGKLAAFEDVEARADGVQDPRLNPIDLRGRLRTLRVEVRNAQGQPVISDLWLVPESGRALALGRGPLVTLDRRSEGYLVGLVGPGLPAIERLGTATEIQLASPPGQEVELRWAGARPLAEYGASFELELRPSAEVLAAAGPARALGFALRRSPRAAWLRTEGRTTIRIPAPGLYELYWRARVPDEGDGRDGERLEEGPEVRALSIGARDRVLEVAPDEVWARSLSD